MKKQLIILMLFLTGVAACMHAQEGYTQEATYFPKGSLSIRTNIPLWLLLTPSLGLEYKASDNLGLLVDGAWSHWDLGTQNKYWRIWNVAPQVRRYFGEAKYNYIGVQYTMGEYNLTGSQGKYMGGGLTLGHQFDCGKNLLVDMGISLGYLYLHDKEEYERIGGHDYRTKPKSSHGYWGPTGLSVSLVWKIN